jgi:hypothetical protein
MNNRESKYENDPEGEPLRRVVSEEEIAALPSNAQRIVRAHLRAAGLRIVSTPDPERAGAA